MADRIIENPIINSPYRAPARYFKFDNEGITNEIVAGRRPSSYFVPVPRPRKRGRQIELEFTEFTADQIRLNDFVNQVRDRVDIWRQRGRPHVTPTTRRLLEYWTDPERSNPILFCQLEAAETAIYLAEAATKDSQAWIHNRLGDINTEHNQSLNRVALKMATGSGKTVVMAMLIAWQTLNKVASPNDARFTQRFLVVSPGLTIKDRLRVLLPENKPNYYSERTLVPADLETDLGQAKIVITNYHAFKRRETKQGQAIGSLTKQMLAGSAKAASPFLESWSQVATRICKPLGVGFQELTGQNAQVLEVLNLDEKGKSQREMVNDGLLAEIKGKIAVAGADLRENRLPRLGSWCKTCDDCDLAGLCRNRP